MTSMITLADYFDEWVDIYKLGAVRDVTLKKYHMSSQWVHRLAPNLLLQDVTRQTYQKLINEYALCHERQTTMDFHHHIKGALLDALDDNLITKDPTRKVVIKGRKTRQKKLQYLNKVDVQKLVEQLDLTETITFDWLILLMLKTGMRFSEAIAVTPADFDFLRQDVSVNKTIDYKHGLAFEDTKNKSSKRKIKLDYQIAMQFFQLTRDIPADVSIFAYGRKRIYNSTVNDRLERLCKQAGIPVISVHGLRHTHASLLLCAGVSILSVSRRLGHSSVDITQKIYLHIIRELENADTDKIMKELSSILV